MHCAQLVFVDNVVVNTVLFPWLGPTANYHMLKISFLGISFLAMASHARTMLTDPGAVPIEYQPSTLVRSARRLTTPASCWPTSAARSLLARAWVVLCSPVRGCRRLLPVAQQ